MALEKPLCLGALLFLKSMHKELQFCLFKHSLLDPLEEPKRSAPTDLYASDLAPCQIVSMGIEYGSSITMDLGGLITLWSFILLITFLAILDFIDGVHISSRQSNAPYINIYIHIYIYYLYICLQRVTHVYAWNSPHFMRWKLAHSWWGSNPRSLDYIPGSITRHVSDHQSKASPIYFYISGSPNKEIVYENDKKCEFNMSDDGHFEFYDLWGNGVIYSLAYGRNGFSTKFSYRNNKWSTFPQKCLQVFI